MRPGCRLRTAPGRPPTGRAPRRRTAPPQTPVRPARSPRRTAGCPARSSWVGAGPGPGVLAVVARPAALAQAQRAECVDHDGEFVEVLDADRALVRAGLRAVGVAA